LLQSHDAPYSSFLAVQLLQSLDVHTYHAFQDVLLACVFLDAIIACDSYHSPSCFLFYVMFMLLLVAIQWFQAMMLLLLLLPSSLIALSYDAPFVCASW
jgi:hypothetical protein